MPDPSSTPQSPTSVDLLGPHFLCTHYVCRCARANELAIIASITGQGRFLLEAIEVHSQQVRCRQPNKLTAIAGGEAPR